MNDQERPRPVRHPRLTSHTVEGEVVILDPEQNIVRMLNEVGSRVWDLSDGSRDVDEIARILTREFNVTHAEASTSVAAFLRDLDEKRLILWQ